MAVARGNEKGRVERAVRYVRDGFFAAASLPMSTISMLRPTPGAAGAAADRRLSRISRRCSVRAGLRRGDTPPV